MNSFFHQIVEHPLTQRKVDIIAESHALLCKFREQLLHVDDIVSAQFYYTNPLLYMFLNGNIEHHACLYDNVYLLNTSLWDEIEVEYPILAVNDLFVKQIGFDTTDKFSQLTNVDTLQIFREQSGLYLIGIDVSVLEDPEG